MVSRTNDPIDFSRFDSVYKKTVSSSQQFFLKNSRALFSDLEVNSDDSSFIGFTFYHKSSVKPYKITI